MTEDTPNRVSVSLGFKKNLGNYESLNVNVSLSSDKTPDETTADAFRRVKDFVKAALVEAVTESLEELE